MLSYLVSYVPWGTGPVIMPIRCCWTCWIAQVYNVGSHYSGCRNECIKSFNNILNVFSTVQHFLHKIPKVNKSCNSWHPTSWYKEFGMCHEPVDPGRSCSLGLHDTVQFYPLNWPSCGTTEDKIKLKSRDMCAHSSGASKCLLTLLGTTLVLV